METPDLAAAEPARKITPAPAEPLPTPWLSVERVENGFVIGAHFPSDRDSRAQRIAHTPAEAGAAVAELLARHMPAARLDTFPRFAVIRPPAVVPARKVAALKAEVAKLGTATAKPARKAPRITRPR